MRIRVDKLYRVNWHRIGVIAFCCFTTVVISWAILADSINAEKQQVRDLKMDRIYRYCKESPICNNLDEQFTKFTSGITVGKYE